MTCLELLLCIGLQICVSVKAFLGYCCDHSLQLGQSNPDSALQLLQTCQRIPDGGFQCLGDGIPMLLCADACVLKPCMEQ